MNTLTRILRTAVLYTALAFSTFGNLYCNKKDKSPPYTQNTPTSRPGPARNATSPNSLESVVESTTEQLQGVHTTILLGRHKTKEDAEKIIPYITSKHSFLCLEGEARQDQIKTINSLLNQEIEKYKNEDLRTQQEIGKRFLRTDSPLRLKFPEFDLQLLLICAKYNLRINYFEYYPVDKVQEWEEEERKSNIDISLAVYGPNYRAENLQQAKEDMLRNATYKNKELVKAVEESAERLIRKLKERDEKIDRFLSSLEESEKGNTSPVCNRTGKSFLVLTE